VPGTCFSVWKVHSQYTPRYCRVNYNPLKSFPVILNFQNTPLGLIPLSEVAFPENNLTVQINRDSRYTKHCWILLFCHLLSTMRVLPGALGVGCSPLTDQTRLFPSPQFCFFPCFSPLQSQGHRGTPPTDGTTPEQPLLLAFLPEDVLLKES